MNIDEMNQAIRDAQNKLEIAEIASTKMAGILRGRLRNVSPYILKSLKRELRDFNIATGKWKHGR